MKHEVKPLTEADFDEIVDQWEEFAGVDEFASELKIPLGHLLHQLKSDAKGFESTVSLHSVRDKSTGDCMALVELIDSDRKGLTKILKFIISPWFWRADTEIERRALLADVHIDTYTQVIESKLANGMQEVKVYGREDAALNILQSVHDNWPHGDRIRVQMQGRWLSIKAPLEGK